MNITKRGKSYRIQIYNGNGQRITKTYNPPEGLTDRQRYNAAYKYALELEEKIKRGGSVKYDNLTFAEFTRLYFENYAPGLKVYTAAQYMDICKNRLIPYFGNMKIINITALDVRQWITELDRQNAPGVLSANSKGVYFRTLSALLGVAVKWDIIPDNPCKKVTTPRKPQTDVKALQAPEVARLFDRIDNYQDKRAVILCYIFLLTGVRASEAAGLKWSDIDYNNRVVKIARECLYIPKKGLQVTPPKSRAGLRDIYIPDLLLDKLAEYKAIQNAEIYARGDLYTNEDYIITQFNGAPVHTSTIRALIKKAFEFCGVDYITVHGLRHTYASLLIAGGVDVRTTAAQLGHSTPALTLNTYANPQNAAKRRAADRLTELLQSDYN